MHLRSVHERPARHATPGLAPHLYKLTGVGDGLSIGPRRLADVEEYVAWKQIMRSGFTDWYGDVPSGRRAKAGWRDANTRAALFPRFTHEVRTDDGKAIAYFNTVPAYWGGAAQALHDLHYYLDGFRIGNRGLYLAKPLHRLLVETFGWSSAFTRLTNHYRRDKLRGANTVVFVSMAIDREHRGMHIPTKLLDATTSIARRLGMAYVVAPFRPSGYGGFKAAGRHAHTPELFDQYCRMTRSDGAPEDPWLRILARNGVHFLRPEPRSFRVTGSIDRFQSFRQSHRPTEWYSPDPDVWECGETQTWYVDRYRGTVTSVEPNIWGFIDIRVSSG